MQRPYTIATLGDKRLIQVILVLKPESDCPFPDPVADQSLESMTWELPLKISEAQIQQLSPTALAYLGDAVYELFIRTYYLHPPKRSQSYHHLVVDQVRAETQALHLRSLTPHLSHTELEVVRWGRNATSRRPKRVQPEVYQQATSLETLMGYLYLTNPQRLNQLLTQLELKTNPEES